MVNSLHSGAVYSDYTIHIHLITKKLFSFREEKYIFFIFLAKIIQDNKQYFDVDLDIHKQEYIICICTPKLFFLLELYKSNQFVKNN